MREKVAQDSRTQMKWTRNCRKQSSRPSGSVSAACRWAMTSLLAAGAALAAFSFAPQEAAAQEILLTGPLAGAGAVHKMRLYRKERFEFAPTLTFTLLDEYMRQAIVGARLSYNFTDYLSLGIWGGVSPGALQFEAGLVDRIQEQTDLRRTENSMRAAAGQQPDIYNRLTSVNVGREFSQQLGTIDWIAAPQLKFVPFRGKIALFQSLYVDSDLFFFAGPAIVGLSERTDCAGPGPDANGGCSSEVASNATSADGTPIGIPNEISFSTTSRVAIAPTFGLGFTFYLSRWASFGAEWRATPFSRNTGGFDNHGGGPDSDFPDQAIDEADRDLKLNQMLSVSIGISMPFDYQVTE